MMSAMGRTRLLPADARVVARGFAAADAYERGRPAYPPAAIRQIAAGLGLGAGARVLDLAAGTGQLTRALIPLVGTVVAVEPSAAMRGELARRVPAAELLAGTAERLPLHDGSVDTAVVGEAFHWFDGDPALAELARVLPPGGGLALVWNVAIRRDPPWPAKLRERLLGLRDAAVPPEHRYGSGAWREAFVRSDRFAEPAATSFEHDHRLDAAGFVAQIASFSYVASLPEAERRATLARAAALAPAASVARLRTDVHLTRRLG